MLARVDAALSHPAPVTAQPMFFASAEQANALQDRPDDREGGVYLPLRKTAAGKFNMPLYAAPVAAPAAPEGFALVPAEVTKAMQDAWDSAPFNEDSDEEFRNAYRAMLKATPTAAPAPASEAVAQSITIDFKQATELLEMFGDQPCEITLTAYPKDEHHFEEGFSIAAGLYAHCTDCPEEGSNYLGVPDYDAIPAGDSADAPVQQAGGWGINHSAGRPILVHKNCSVIEAEDAEYVLRLIAADRAALKGEQPVEPSGTKQPSAELIEAAAKVIAECMDYPWEHMPEEGRENMRRHAKAVAAALAGPKTA